MILNKDLNCQPCRFENKTTKKNIPLPWNIFPFKWISVFKCLVRCDHPHHFLKTNYSGETSIRHTMSSNQSLWWQHCTWQCPIKSWICVPSCTGLHFETTFTLKTNTCQSYQKYLYKTLKAECSLCI